MQYLQSTLDKIFSGAKIDSIEKFTLHILLNMTRESEEMTVGENIAKLRKEAGFTQENFAEKLEVSRVSVSSWETDKCRPDTNSLLKCAELLGCSLDMILMKQEANQ